MKTAAIVVGGPPPSGATVAKALRKTKPAEKIGEYTWNSRTLAVWGWRDGKAGTENKHELPPPLDEGLLFGDALVVSDGDLTVDDWSQFYDQAFSGFESTGSSSDEDESADESESIDGDVEDDASDGVVESEEDDAASEEEAAEEESENEADGEDGDCYDDGEEGGGSKRRPSRRRAVAAPEYRRMEMGVRSRVPLPGTPGKRAPKWHTAAELIHEDEDDGDIMAPLRQRVMTLITSRMDQLLDPDQRTDLEKGIYNASLEVAHQRGVRRHWENTEFTVIYKTVARRTVANLDPECYVGNSRLIQRLQDGEFSPHQVAFMNARGLYPEHWQELADEQLKRETTMLEGGNQEGSDMFKCRRCGKSKTRYWQMQTRSADEPMTTFIRCLNCGKEWRE